MPKTSTKLKTVNNENIDPTNPENTNTGEQTVESENPSTSEIIDVEWERIQHIFDHKTKLEKMEEYFAQMCLQFEKNKANMMSQIMYGQNDLYSLAQALKKDMNVDENLTYELKLPVNHGEKGFFVRKDEE